MEFLTAYAGNFPLGIWISIVVLCLVSGSNLLFQAISVINWKLALRMRVQEHAPDDPDIVNRTHMVMEWGFSVADFVSHIVIFPLAIVLTIKGHVWGFVLSTFLYVFYMYVGILATAQRYGLVKFGLKPSFREYVGVLTLVWLVAAFAIIGAISLWINSSCFGF